MVNHPDGTAKAQNDLIRTPDTTVDYPDGTAKAQSNLIKTPDTTVDYPDGTAKAQSDLIKTPDTTVDYPDGTAKAQSDLIKRWKDMVKRRRKLLSVILASFFAIVIAAGCGQEDSSYTPPKKADTEQKETDGGFSFGQDQDQETEEDRWAGIVMQGPDIPPENTRYDEWKGFQYTTDTSFNLRTYWAIGTYFESNIVQNPLHIEDAVLTIIDAKEEPVGGEMKLRSGGYVDITIETRWTGTMICTTDDRNNVYFSHVAWSDNDLLPCDAYTGTSLLNFMDDEETENDSIGIGEAFDTGMVESDVTWNGRTYRLFAKTDKRNASFQDDTYIDGGLGVIVSIPGAVETTYTFRVPADYDGLVLAIDKDTTDEKDVHIDEYSEFLHVVDTYADILTTDVGVKQTADDFYFIKVSDLLQHFRNQ